MYKTTLLILTALFLLSFVVSSNDDWKKYPYSDQNSEIVFPFDEGKHDLRIGLEWWYYVIHATGLSTGHKYSILVTHFNTNTRFFTITNLTTKNHKSASVQGKLNSAKQKLDIKHTTKFGIDTFKNIAPFSYEVDVFGPKMRLSGSFSATKKPMMIVGTGYVPIGTSGHSWYYSLTRSTFTGSLQLNSINEKISGEVWMDHQWGPFLVSPLELGKIFESYEWFCIQLDNGTDIMISDIFNRNYKLPRKPGYGQVEYIDKNGNSEYTFERNFIRTHFWQDPISKKYMSMGWALDVPKWNLKLSLTPTQKNQMVRIPLKADFWEGSIEVTGELDGKEVKGKGFGELIHKFKIPNIKLWPMRSRYRKNRSITVRWKIKNKDDGNPLTQMIVIKDEDDHIEQFYVEDNKHKFKLIRSGKYRIHIVAKSIDSVISGKSKEKTITIY